MPLTGMEFTTVVLPLVKQLPRQLTLTQLQLQANGSSYDLRLTRMEPVAGTWTGN